MDANLIKATYSRMSDAELTRVATRDAAGLTPEARDIIKEEIGKRGLDPAMLKGVQAQNEGISEAEFDRYCGIVRSLDCPHCGTSGGLNGTLTARTMSIIIFTTTKKELVVACPDCLRKANTEALLTTVLLGWWGIPWDPSNRSRRSSIL